MKRLFFFLFPVFVLACNGVEKHRADIEELSGNWDNTTKAITDFKAAVSNDLANYTQALAAMQPAISEDTKMDTDKAASWEAAQRSVTDALGAYGPFLQTINDFETTWNEKSAEVTALKDGLAAGKIEGDVPAKLTELNAMITQANEKLAEWKSSYATLKGNVDASMAALPSLDRDLQ